MLRLLLVVSGLCLLACAGPGMSDAIDSGDVEGDDDAAYPDLGSLAYRCSGDSEYNYEFEAGASEETTAIWVTVWLGEETLGEADLVNRSGDWYAEVAPADFGGTRCTDVEYDLLVTFSASTDGDRLAEQTENADYPG